MPIDDYTDETGEKVRSRRGLWRLMLRLPTMRGDLQILAAKSHRLDALCAAYEDASVTLARLRKERHNADQTLLAEYRMICEEIESDVIQYCLTHDSSVSE
ncbi:hypothetical protein ABK249_32100 [Neorhizobium sp. Rsf11]|uniref:Uncharacterized protein n=1 Tax=Neorhizobium phenanthreniclasticum TaxID=3157917 RepID=A0ABV0MCW1_9HYPH